MYNTFGDFYTATVNAISNLTFWIIMLITAIVFMIVILIIVKDGGNRNPTVVVVSPGNVNDNVNR